MPDDAAAVDVRLVVNGREAIVHVHPMARLLDVLRQDLRLTGTKEGCGEGECGACSVLVNGELANSCLLPVLQAADASITTIEGVGGDDGELHAVQRAFIDHGGAQCGICTPGMVLAAVSLIDRHPDPTLAEIRSGLSGNLCRCTGYIRIFEAVVQAAGGRGAGRVTARLPRGESRASETPGSSRANAVHRGSEVARHECS